MRSPASPFTDPGQVRGSLYALADRLASRTRALHRARVSGRHADPATLAAELRRRAIDEPFTMTSVVTYLVARRKTATL